MGHRFILRIAKDDHGGALAYQSSDLDEVSRFDAISLFCGRSRSVHQDADRLTCVIGPCLPPSSIHHGPRASRCDRQGPFVEISCFSDGRVSVLRDPSAGQPCYYLDTERAVIFASDIGLLLDGAGQAAIVDWDAIADLLLFPGHHSNRTALHGVFELLPGQQASILAGGLRISTAWSPWDVSVDERISSKDATFTLGSALDIAHREACPAGARALATVSGGLDSSIVAASAHRQGADLTLVTFYTEDKFGDERQQADLLAQCLGKKLVVFPYRAPTLDAYLNMRSFLPRPTNRAMALGIDSTLQSLAYEHQCSTIYNGYGGDSVFCSLRSARPLADAMLRSWSLATVSRVTASVAELTGASYPELWRAALRSAIAAVRGTSAYSWPRNTRMLSRAACEREQPESRHPWLISPKGAPPGKAAQIASIVAAHNHLERFPQQCAIDCVSPLLTLPVLTAALSFPTWMWFAHGSDRIIARDAISGRIGPDLAYRRSKGTPVALHSRFFEEHRREIGQHLSEGVLAGQGLLDAGAIAEYCNRGGPATGTDFLRLLELADVETWCRYWSRPHQGSLPSSLIRLAQTA